jgi:hypothetical protein
MEDHFSVQTNMESKLVANIENGMILISTKNTFLLHHFVNEPDLDLISNRSSTVRDADEQIQYGGFFRTVTLVSSR